MLVVPNLRAVAALVVAIEAAVSTAAGGLLVAAPVALDGGLFLLVVIVVVIVIPPGAETLRRRIFVGGIVVLFFFLLIGGGEVVLGEAVVLALHLQLPIGEELEVIVSVGQGLVILGPDGGIMVLLVPFLWGAAVVRRHQIPLRRGLAGGGR
jgi:hypothetical protein